MPRFRRSFDLSVSSSSIFTSGKCIFLSTTINTGCSNNLCVLPHMSAGLYPRTLVSVNYKQKLLPGLLSMQTYTHTHTHTHTHKHTPTYTHSHHSYTSPFHCSFNVAIFRNESINYSYPGQPLMNAHCTLYYKLRIWVKYEHVTWINNVFHFSVHVI